MFPAAVFSEAVSLTQPVGKYQEFHVGAPNLKGPLGTNHWNFWYWGVAKTFSFRCRSFAGDLKSSQHRGTKLHRERANVWISSGHH